MKRKIRFASVLLVLSSLLLSFSSWADQSVVLSSRLTVSQAQVDEFARQLPRMSEDRIFYHWSGFVQGLRWAEQGRVDAGEVAALSSDHRNMAAGGGVYLADNPTSSRDYGPFPTVFRIRKGTPIFDATLAQKIFGRSLSMEEKAALGQRVPFIHNSNVTNGWWVTHHPANTQEVVGGTLPQFNVKINLTKVTGVIPLAKVFAELHDNNSASQHYRNTVGYLESFYQLMSYMDGIALTRAVRVNPRNPWNEFEPHNFESFRRAVEGFHLAAASGKRVGVSQGGAFGDGTSDALTWAAKQVDEILPMLNARLSGRSVNQVQYRDEGIRAGGSDRDKRFFASPGQVKVLEANPYLEVDKVPSGDGFLVAYYYPDVFHYSKLVTKGYIPLDLVKELRALQPSDLLANHSLRQRLNQRLMRELLLNLFMRLYRQPVGFSTSSGLAAILDLVSIHPFDDYNGRTTRFYSEVAQLDSGMEPARSYMSDLDLVTPPAKYGEFLVASTQQLHALKLQMLEEALNAIAQRRGADHFALEGWKNLSLALRPFGLTTAVEYDSRDLELIRERKFVELLDKLLGKKWNTRASLYLDDSQLFFRQAG